MGRKNASWCPPDVWRQIRLGTLVAGQVDRGHRSRPDRTEGFLSADRYSVHADPGHESSNAMFGGWASVVSLRAVLATADDDALPAAITINYVERIVPGDDVIVLVEKLGGGRSISHWRADVRASDDDRVLTAATVALANRRETDGYVEPTMPDAPEPESLIAFSSPGPQGQRTLIRQISGVPPGTSSGTGSVHWGPGLRP